MMSPLSSKKKANQADDEVDQQSIDNGALESSFQYSAAAEKKLVRKIDLMYVCIDQYVLPTRL
jgi:hypothetical protein